MMLCRMKLAPNGVWLFTTFHENAVYHSPLDYQVKASSMPQVVNIKSENFLTFKGIIDIKMGFDFFHRVPKRNLCFI